MSHFRHILHRSLSLFLFFFFFLGYAGCACSSLPFPPGDFVTSTPQDVPSLSTEAQEALQQACVNMEVCATKVSKESAENTCSTELNATLYANFKDAECTEAETLAALRCINALECENVRKTDPEFQKCWNTIQTCKGYTPPPSPQTK